MGAAKWDSAPEEMERKSIFHSLFLLWLDGKTCGGGREICFHRKSDLIPQKVALKWAFFSWNAVRPRNVGVKAEAPPAGGSCSGAMQELVDVWSEDGPLSVLLADWLLRAPPPLGCSPLLWFRGSRSSTSAWFEQTKKQKKKW